MILQPNHLINIKKIYTIYMQKLQNVSKSTRRKKKSVFFKEKIQNKKRPSL